MSWGNGRLVLNVLTTVKILLQLNTSEKDQLLSALIKSMKSKVKNYCNRCDIPPSLEDIIAEMVVALYKKEYGDPSITLQSNVVVAAGSVKRESIGDYSIEYNTASSGSSKSYSSASSDIIHDFRGQLNAFRRPKYV